MLEKLCAGGQDGSMVGGFWFWAFPYLSLDSLLFIPTIHFVWFETKVLGSLSLNFGISKFPYL